MPKIHFKNENQTVQVNSCSNLRKVARENGVQIYQGIHTMLNCHGLGVCGTCAVEVDDVDALSPKRRGEDKILTAKGKNGANRRLACQSVVYRDVTVKTLG